jgi:hypothetical protein
MAELSLFSLQAGGKFDSKSSCANRRRNKIYNREEIAHGQAETKNSRTAQ